jgi:thioredoxin-like negative regulator of GroEL
MLVLFTVPGCGYCERMIRDASADEQVVRLSTRFVCVLVDADQEPEICREFRVRGYPTVQFISPRGVPLNRLTGRTPSDQLSVQMQAALRATASRLRHAVESAVR